MTDDTSGATVKAGEASTTVPEGRDREPSGSAGNPAEREEASSAGEDSAIDLDTARDRAS